MTPCIITVAITGSLPGKKDNPAVHLHVRDDEGKPTSDPKRFARVGMITQLSTGGRSGSGRERGRGA